MCLSSPLAPWTGGCFWAALGRGSLGPIWPISRNCRQQGQGPFFPAIWLLAGLGLAFAPLPPLLVSLLLGPRLRFRLDDDAVQSEGSGHMGLEWPDGRDADMPRISHSCSADAKKWIKNK